MVKKNFTRKDLAHKIFKKLGFSKNFSSLFLDSFFETLSKQLIENKKVKLTNFGTFLTSDKRGEKYINKNIYNYKLIEIPRISKNFFKLPYVFLFLIVSFFKSFFFMKKNNIQILMAVPQLFDIVHYH